MTYEQLLEVGKSGIINYQFNTTKINGKRRLLATVGGISTQIVTMQDKDCNSIRMRGSPRHIEISLPLFVLGFFFACRESFSRICLTKNKKSQTKTLGN